MVVTRVARFVSCLVAALDRHPARGSIAVPLRETLDWSNPVAEVRRSRHR